MSKLSNSSIATLTALSSRDDSVVVFRDPPREKRPSKAERRRNLLWQLSRLKVQHQADRRKVRASGLV